MPRPVSPDRKLFGVTVALVVIGVVMVGSSSSYYALSRTGMSVSWPFLIRQILFAAAGLFLMVRLMKTDYRWLAKPGVVFGLVGGTLVLLLLVFVFEEHKGTHRWIPLGPVNLQPSELAKLSLAVFLASMAERKGEELRTASVGIIPAYAVAGLLAGLVLLQPDMGTAVVLLAVTTIVLFAAGMSWRWLAGAAAACVALLPLAILAAPYRIARLTAFLHPDQNLEGSNFQLFQSKIALGNGGVFGSGIALGRQTYLFLPEAHTDFIFSVIGEELGLVGTLVVLSLFVIVLWRGLRAALRATDRFGAYLALGITMFLVFQAFMNMGVATGLLPTKGMPLPFVSYGGSSLIVSLGMMGILLNVSQQGE